MHKYTSKATKHQKFLIYTKNWDFTSKYLFYKRCDTYYFGYILIQITPTLHQKKKKTGQWPSDNHAAWKFCIFMVSGKCLHLISPTFDNIVFSNLLHVQVNYVDNQTANKSPTDMLRGNKGFIEMYKVSPINYLF